MTLTKSDFQAIDNIVVKRVAPVEKKIDKVGKKLDKVDKKLDTMFNFLDKDVSIFKAKTAFHLGVSVSELSRSSA